MAATTLGIFALLLIPLGFWIWSILDLVKYSHAHSSGAHKTVTLHAKVDAPTQLHETLTQSGETHNSPAPQPPSPKPTSQPTQGANMNDRERILTRFGLAALLAVALTACGPDEEVPEAETSASVPGATAEPAGETPNLDAPAEETSKPAISYRWRTGKGYEFAVGLLDPRTEVQSDTVNQDPGKALINLTVDGRYKITNDTPGRNANIGDVRGGWTHAPAWALDSTVCKYVDEFKPAESLSDLPVGYEIRYDVAGLSSTAEQPSAGYCSVAVAGLGGDFGTLSSGQSTTVASTGSVVILTLDEADLSDLMRELKQPDFWFIQKPVPSERHTIDDKRCSTHPLSPANLEIVATTSAGKEVCAQDEED